jgi:hypothetical protein
MFQAVSDAFTRVLSVGCFLIVFRFYLVIVSYFCVFAVTAGDAVGLASRCGGGCLSQRF